MRACALPTLENKAAFPHLERDDMQQIEEDIKTGSFHSVYLIFGEEAYLKLFWKKKLREALVSADDTMNCTVYSGKDLDVGALIDQAETMPFFADHRLILVEDSGLFARGAGGEEEGSAGSSAGTSSAGTGSASAGAASGSARPGGRRKGKGMADPTVLPPAARMACYIPQLPSETILVFVENEVDKRGKLYKTVQKAGLAAQMDHPDEKTLVRWIYGRLKKEKKLIRTSVMERFLEMAGTDMTHIETELEKLISYTEGREEITREDLETVCVEMTEAIVFRMIDEMTLGHQKKAMDIYYDLISQKEPPMRILYLISRQFNQLFQIQELGRLGYSRDRIAQQIGAQGFVVRKGQDLARRFESGRLKEAVQDCIAAETDVKTGKLSDRMAVELMIVKYSI